MAIMAECPICRKKQSVKNKRCSCGQNMDSAKRSQRVRYWISYRMPDGKQRRESVGAFEGLNAYSKTDAEIAMSKREVQKREKRILDMLPESTITFRELSEWYLELPKIKKLASHRSKSNYLKKFNEVFGDKVVGEITVDDLEEHQELRKKQGWKPASIDKEIGHAKSMINMAFFRGKDKKTKQPLINGDVLREFKALDNKLSKGANVRKRTLSIVEYLKLLDSAPAYFRDILVVAYNTGMRGKELQNLQWKHIDRDAMFIRLPKGYTKNGDARDIPINRHVKAVLDKQPVPINPDIFVFTYKGRPLTHKNGFVDQMSDACNKSNVPYGRNEENGVTFHDIRRTVKTNMLSAGMPKEYRDLILGHSLRGMDRHYLSPSDDDLEREMDRFTIWLDEEFENANVDQSVDQKIY